MNFISTTLVTFNRLEHTKATINSYLENTKIKHELMVIDNGSTDGTREYLQDLYDNGYLTCVVFNGTNLYPGAATNQGWRLASQEANFLHRSDNDLFYKKGWDELVMRAFEKNKEIGLIGLVNELYQLPKDKRPSHESLAVNKNGIKLYPPLNEEKSIGGPCVIRREIFDKGIWYDETPWNQTNKNEDLKFSLAVKEAGYDIYTLFDWKVRHIGFGDFDENYGYYFETYSNRGMLDWLAYRLWQEKAGKIQKGEVV